MSGFIKVEEGGVMKKKYRILKKGETIQADDELDLCRDPWRDDARWVKARPDQIGKEVSDPVYPAHVLVRRLVKVEER